MSGEDLVIDTVDLGTSVRVAVAGEIDFLTAEQLRSALATCADGGRTVALDLTKVQFMDCYGMRVLLDAAARVKATTGRVVLAAASPQVLRFLSATWAGGELPRADGGQPT